MLTNLYLGEITLRTKGKHQLTGYAEIYLGKWGKKIMTFSMVFGLFGALIAYIIGVGTSLAQILPGTVGTYQLIFWLIMAIMIYLGLRAVEESEFILGILIILVVAVIIIFSASSINLDNLASINLAKIFVPYGVILFAFMGFVSIPEAKEELEGKEKKLKKAIIIGFLIPISIYFLFSLISIGTIGLKYFNNLNPNERIATIALGNIIGPHMIILGNIFAVIAMTTSFLALGLAVKEMFIYDYKMKNWIAWLITMTVPYLIVLLKVTNFIEVLALAGVVTGGLTASLILLMVNKAKKYGNRKPEYSIGINRWIITSLLLLFLFGAVYHFINLI